MTRSLPALLSLATLAWTPLPTSVSPEVRLAASHPVPINYTARSVAASDGPGFFVASVVSEYSGGIEQIGMLLDEHGQPALAQSARIDFATGVVPAVASSGRNYLAVWWARGSTLGARFTIAGQRIDREPIVIRAGVATFDLAHDPGPELDVAWNGTHYVVVTDDRHGGFVGALVDAGGRVVRNDLPATGNRIASLNGVSVMATGTLFADAQVAAGTDGFFIVQSRGRDVYGQELDSAGNVRTPERLIAREGFDPAVAWDGTSWVVAYTAFDGDDPLHVIRLGGDETPVKIVDGAYAPSLASNGARALLTWSGSRGTHAALIETDAITQLGSVQRYAGNSTAPSLARVGDATLAAWMEWGQVGGAHLRIQPVRDGVPQSPKTLAMPGLSGILDFASNGSEALLVVASPEPGKRLRFLRIAADGSVLSDNAIDAATGYGTVRWMGTQYLFVWRTIVDNRAHVRALRISATGEILGNVLLASGDAFQLGGGRMAVAGDHALVLFPSYQQNYVDGILLDADLTATPIQRLDFPGGEGSPIEVASDGNYFLVARVRRTQDDTLIWQRVHRDGSLGATGQARIAARSSYSPRLSLFWTGENFLSIVAREDSLYAHRIAPDGASIGDAAARIPLATGVYSTTMSAQITELGRVDLVYLAPAGPSEIREGVVFRTLAPPRRRSVR